MLLPDDLVSVLMESNISINRKFGLPKRIDLVGFVSLQLVPVKIIGASFKKLL